MKFLIVLALAVACANADVSHLDSAAEIVRSTFDNTPEGSYEYAYETSNGIFGEARGVLLNPNSDNPTYQVQGSNRYTSPEGVPIAITYTADENGYQPQGDHLPVPPPEPEYVARAAKYIAEHAPAVVRAAPAAAAAAILG